MSLLGAIDSAVTALNAQSQVLSMVSDNLANSSTYGYKTTYGSFDSMLVDPTDTSYNSGGVTVATRTNVTAQGILAASDTSSNMAINGDGFFVVSDGTTGSDLEYTRDGQFTVDKNGYLENDGVYLMGWKTDAQGNISGGTTTNDLSLIDTGVLATAAKPTTTASLVGNLPANATVGQSFTSTFNLYDSLGNAANSTVTWTKTGDNTWTASFANPTLASNAATTAATVTSGTVTVTFNSDGTLASTSPSPPSLTLTGWTTGAANSSIALNLGTTGAASGLSQYASTDSTLGVSLTVNQDGVAAGSLASIYVDSTDGTLYGKYDNGQSIALYKIPVATFMDPDALTALSGGTYALTDASGTATLHVAGTGGAGAVEGGELEESTTDTNHEFSTMMASQQAYSAAARSWDRRRCL